MDQPTARAQLLGLLQTGERSAEVAFGRITRRLPPAAAAHAVRSLVAIAADEARHGRMIEHAARECRLEPVSPAPGALRFFIRLESRELGVHLARIAALDGCVCQILSRVLASDSGASPATLMGSALAAIRIDEGRHVAFSRALARDLGAHPATFRDADLETRDAFATVLAGYESALEALGVDSTNLLRRIRRDER